MAFLLFVLRSTPNPTHLSIIGVHISGVLDKRCSHLTLSQRTQISQIQKPQCSESTSRSHSQSSKLLTSQRIDSSRLNALDSTTDRMLQAAYKSTELNRTPVIHHTTLHYTKLQTKPHAELKTLNIDDDDEDDRNNGKGIAMAYM